MEEKLQLYSLAKEEGRAIWFLDTLTFVKATGYQTNGHYGLIEQLLPTGFESPYHVHHNEDETFFILEGEATFTSDGDTFKARAGSYIFLPRDIPHGFRVDAACKVLILNSPAGFEEFVIEMSEPAQELNIPHGRISDPEELITKAAEYNVEILGPLPEI